MPEAVNSSSIPASADQPPIATDLTAFDATIHELSALTMMLGATLDQVEALHPDISYGIAGLFRALSDDFRHLFVCAKTDRENLDKLIVRANALARMKGESANLTDEEEAFITTLEREKDSSVGIPLRIHPLAKLELETASSRLGCGVQRLVTTIVHQWLIREGYLSVPHRITVGAAL